ncbi:MAG: hypothetical protein R2748_29655 [Bryobacterales bacterium]
MSKAGHSPELTAAGDSPRARLGGLNLGLTPGLGGAASAGFFRGALAGGFLLPTVGLGLGRRRNGRARRWLDRAPGLQAPAPVPALRSSSGAGAGVAGVSTTAGLESWTQLRARRAGEDCPSDAGEHDEHRRGGKCASVCASPSRPQLEGGGRLRSG